MHTCPDCGQACYCNGDIDDCCIDGGKAQILCGHCWPDCDEDSEDLERWDEDERLRRASE